MDERAGFVRAICLEPEDDTARLAFADWLDERGESEQAGFIRRGIALCRPEGLAPEGAHEIVGAVVAEGMGSWDGIIDLVSQYPPQHPDHCPLCRAIADQRKALDRFGQRVAREIAKWAQLPAEWSGRADPGLAYLAVRFRRGFVHRVSMPHTEFVADHFARRLFSSQPVVEIRLSDRRPARWTGSSFRGLDGKWHWYDKGDVHPLRHRHHVPPELCPLGEGMRHGDDVMLKNTVFFDTEQQALAALSRAAVRFGRHAAGLPELGAVRSAG